VDLGVHSHLTHFRLDELQKAGDLLWGSQKILCRENVNGDNPDVEFFEPVHDLLEFIRTKPVSLEGILEAELSRVTAVAIQNEADVPRDDLPSDLAKEAPLVQSVQQGEGIKHHR